MYKLQPETEKGSPVLYQRIQRKQDQDVACLDLEANLGMQRAHILIDQLLGR
jgi:hypothetical protein